MVTYSAFCNAEGKCPICWEEYGGTDLVLAHSNGGDLHPSHDLCLKRWLRDNDTCPICRAAIDRSTVFTWKDRIIHCTAHLAKSAIIGYVAHIAMIAEEPFGAPVIGVFGANNLL